MTDLPEGVDLDTVRQHVMSLSLIAKTINLYGEHAETEEGSHEESVAELALDEHVASILELGPDIAGSVILALVAVLSDTGDEATIQAWFSHHEAMARAALNG